MIIEVKNISGTCVLFRDAAWTIANLTLKIEWLLRNTADKMWLKKLQNLYT
jgi:hypothetical protein